MLTFLLLLSAFAILTKTVIVSKTSTEPTPSGELWEDDLAGQIHNEYDPMIPNNYEAIVKQRKSEQEKAREEEVGCMECYSVVDICRRNSIVCDRVLAQSALSLPSM